MHVLRGSLCLLAAFTALTLLSCAGAETTSDYTLIASPDSFNSESSQRFARARDYLRQGDLEGAGVLLEELASQHPAEPRVPALRAMVHWRLHRCERAAAALAEAVRLNRGRDDQALENTLEAAAGDWISQVLDHQSACQDSSSKALETLLGLDHGKLSPRHLEQLRQGVAGLASAGRCDAALSLYGALGPQGSAPEAQTLEAVARCLTMLGRDHQLLALAEGFAAEDGPDADARILQLAEIAEERFRFSTAISLLSMSSRPLVSPVVPLHLARLLLMDGRQQEAVIQLEAFCGQPGSSQLRSARLKQAAWLLGRFGLVDEAAEFYGRLETLHGPRWDLLADRAGMLWNAGRARQATELLTEHAVAAGYAPPSLDQAVGFLINVKAFKEALALLAAAPPSPMRRAMTEAIGARQEGHKKLKAGTNGLNGPEGDRMASLLCRLGFKQEAAALLLSQFEARTLGTQGVLTAARCLPQANLEGPSGKLLLGLALPQRPGRMRIAGAFLAALRKRSLLPLAQKHISQLPGPAPHLEADLALQTLLASLPTLPSEASVQVAVTTGLADYAPWQKRDLWLALAAAGHSQGPLPCLSLAVLESPGVFSSGEDWYAGCKDCVPTWLAALAPADHQALLLACKDGDRVARLAAWVENPGSDYGTRRRLQPLLVALLMEEAADDAAALLLKAGVSVPALPQAQEAALLPALARRSPRAALARADAIAAAQTMPRDSRIALAEELTRAGASLVAARLVTSEDLDSTDLAVECSALTIRTLALAGGGQELDSKLTGRLVVACPEQRLEILVEDLLRQGKALLASQLAADYLLAHDGIDGRSLFASGFEAAQRSGEGRADAWLEQFSRSQSPALLAMTGWSGALLGRLDRGASLLARSLALRPGDEGTLGHYLGVLSARRIVQAAPQDPKLPGLVQRYLEARLEDEPAPALDRVLVTTLRAGLTPEAGAIYRLCKSRFPDLEIKPLVRGLLALEEGRREEAKEAFLEAVSGGPEPQKAAAEACSRLRAVGQPEACVEIFDRALERLPGDGPLSLAAAAVFLELGNRERGAKLLEDSLQASPELLALALPMIRSLQMDGLSDSLQDLLDEASLGTDSASSTIFSFLLRHYAITGQEQRLSALLARLARVTLPYFVEERAEQLYSLGFHSEATALLEGRPGTGGLSLGLHLLASGDSVHGRALIMDFLEKTFGEMPRFGDDQAEVSPPVMALFGGVSSLLWEAGLREQSLWVLERLSRQFPGSPTLRVQILARQLTKQPLCSEAVEDLRGLLNLPAAPLDGAEVSALVLRLHNAGCGPAILNLMAGEISVSRSPWWLATYVQQALRLGEEKIRLPNAEGLASLTPGVVANTAAALLRAGQRPQALALLDKHLEAEGLEESGPGEDDEEGSLQKARRRRGEENEVLVQLVLASTDRPLAFQRLTEQLLSAPDGSRHGTRIRLAGLATRLDLQGQVAASLRAALPLSNNPKEEALALLRNRLMVGDLPGARVAFASALTGGGGLETILDFYSGAVSKLELAFARELLVLGAKAFPRDQSLAVENLKILALEGEPQAVRQAWDALLLATPKLQQAELAMQFGLLLGSLGHEDLATGLLALATQPRGLAVRAMEAAEAGRLNQAQELVDLALSQSPSPSFLRAAIFEQLPARPEGLALASHLLNATAPNARAYTPAASYWAALDAGAQGNFQRALELALRSARGIESRQERFPFLGLTLLDSGMPLPQVQQIMNIYFHGLDRRQALAFLAQAMLDLDMEAAKSAGAKALLELTLGKARELLEDYPTDEWLISQEAELLRTLGRSQEAEATYRGALQRSPGDPGLMNNLAYLLALENRSLDEGLELAQRALVLDPSQVPFYRDTLGWLHHRRGEGRAAEAEVLAALKASDFSASQGLGECLFHLASIKAAAGDEGAALRWFRLALFKDAPGYLKAEIRSYLKTHSATREVR